MPTARIKFLAVEIDGVEQHFPPETLFDAGNMFFNNTSNGFVSDNAQGAIEEVKNYAASADFDSLVFGIASNVSAEKFLYNVFQVPSNTAPAPLAYNVVFRRLAFFNSNDAAAFNIKVYKVNPGSDPGNPANYTLIIDQQFSGYSGYYNGDYNINVDAGYGIAVSIAPPASGTKPANVNVRVLYRQRP